MGRSRFALCPRGLGTSSIRTREELRTLGAELVGELDAARLESWRRLHREVAVESGRRSVRLAAMGGRPDHTRPRR